MKRIAEVNGKSEFPLPAKKQLYAFDVGCVSIANVNHSESAVRLYTATPFATRQTRMNAPQSPRKDEIRQGI